MVGRAHGREKLVPGGDRRERNCSEKTVCSDTSFFHGLVRQAMSEKMNVREGRLTTAGEIKSRKAFAVLENTEKKEEDKEDMHMEKGNESGEVGEQGEEKITTNQPKQYKE